MSRYPHPDRVQALQERLEDIHGWFGPTLHLKRLPQGGRKPFGVLRLRGVLAEQYSLFELREKK
ncbi:MAG: hypothetical protein H7A21_08505 [Spirochaetales bacterium]|nr:hypothetical protein [Leptospiraceae bacterium]MCP5481457.1 hypothetical protein [Spirochaetales bacterium]